MAHTAISDIVVPEVWAPYMWQESTTKTALFTSGILAMSPDIQAQLNAGGQFISVPSMNALSGNSEVLSDSSSMTVNNLTAEEDIAVRLMRGKGWGWSDLVKWVTSQDTLEDDVIMNISAWWARDMQTTLIQTLEGIFATALASTHVYDGTAATMTAATISNAVELLGDAREQIVAICMHSHVVSDLEQADQIDYLRDSESGVMIRRYQGKYTIIEDDGCPVTSGTPDTYRSYLFAGSSIAFGEAQLAADEAIEPDRDAAASSSRIFTRRNYIMHPIGVKYAGAANPTNTTLATGASWTKVYDDKNIRLIAVDTQ